MFRYNLVIEIQKILSYEGGRTNSREKSEFVCRSFLKWEISKKSARHNFIMIKSKNSNMNTIIKQGKYYHKNIYLWI